MKVCSIEKRKKKIEDLKLLLIFKFFIFNYSDKQNFLN